MLHRSLLSIKNLGMLNQTKRTRNITKTKENPFKQKVDSILYFSGECEKDYSISTHNIFTGRTITISTYA